MSEETYYQKDRILNKAKDYQENDKEKLRHNAREKYRSLSEEKNKRDNMEERDITCLKKRNKN